jgi:hypothetical protein
MSERVIPGIDADKNDLAQKPKASVIAASHTTELAEKWGRRVRNLVSEHGSMLRLELSSDSQAAGRWALTSGGKY